MPLCPSMLCNFALLSAASILGSVQAAPLHRLEPRNEFWMEPKQCLFACATDDDEWFKLNFFLPRDVVRAACNCELFAAEVVAFADVALDLLSSYVDNENETDHRTITSIATTSAAHAKSTYPTTAMQFEQALSVLAEDGAAKNSAERVRDAKLWLKDFLYERIQYADDEIFEWDEAASNAVEPILENVLLEVNEYYDTIRVVQEKFDEVLDVLKIKRPVDADDFQAMTDIIDDSRKRIAYMCRLRASLKLVPWLKIRDSPAPSSVQA